MERSMKDIRSVPIALAVLMSAGGAVSAAPGLTTADVNVRRGPGMNFPVVTTIPGRSKVDVRSCDAGWCAVRFGPYAGWVNARDLDFGVPRRPHRYAPPSPPRH